MKVTDACLVHLSELKNLRILFLDGTMVTEKGERELQKALPNCEVHLIPRLPPQVNIPVPTDSM
jgi:hypothetical protein